MTSSGAQSSPKNTTHHLPTNSSSEPLSPSAAVAAVRNNSNPHNSINPNQRLAQSMSLNAQTPNDMITYAAQSIAKQQTKNSYSVPQHHLHHHLNPLSLQFGPGYVAQQNTHPSRNAFDHMTLRRGKWTHVRILLDIRLFEYSLFGAY